MTKIAIYKNNLEIRCIYTLIYVYLPIIRTTDNGIKFQAQTTSNLQAFTVAVTSFRSQPKN